MSCPRYMLSIEVAGNKRYCMKLKTRISNHKGMHKQLQEDMELFCERNGFEEMSEGYANFCGGTEKIIENWSKEFEDFFPEYRTEEDEKQRQKEIKALSEKHSKERLAELFYNQLEKNKRMVGVTEEEK